MCGVVGEVFSTKSILGDLIDLDRVQCHRGPDSQARLKILKRRGGGVILSHQRLSVININTLANQPMVSNCDRYTLIFNGEVYNYIELNNKYDLGVEEDGDSRVLLELIAKIGLCSALKEISGFWALALYDTHTEKLFLSRDRIGKKPLYYTQIENSILFASELNSFANKNFKKTLELDKVKLFIEKGLHPAANSWFKEIVQVEPGNILSVKQLGKKLKIKNEASLKIISEDNNVTIQRAKSECINHVKKSIERRLRSDVKVGVAVSGGIDSAIIAAIAKNEKDVEFISVADQKAVQSEYKFSETLANYLNIEVSYVAPQYGNSLWQTMIEVSGNLDGPFTSFSQVQFYLMCKRCKERGITVLLTGQGADEVFLGYKKYTIFEFMKLIRSRQFMKALRFIIPFKGFLTKNDVKLSNLLKFKNRQNNALLGVNLKNIKVSNESFVNFNSDVQSASYQDLTSTSVPYLVKYEDRMGMAASVEVRNPFLDLDVVNFGFNLPISEKLKNGWSKYILRDCFQNLLPDEIVWRRDKQGFISPEYEIFLSISENINQLLKTDCLIFEMGLVDRSTYEQKLQNFLRKKSKNFREVFYPISLELYLRSCENVDVSNNI